MEEDCAVAQVMDSDVQGQVEVDGRRMVRGVGTESTGASPSRVAMKRRKVGVMVIGPGTRKCVVRSSCESDCEAKRKMGMKKLPGKQSEKWVFLSLPYGHVVCTLFVKILGCFVGLFELWPLE
jgi:hypothetical protein